MASGMDRNTLLLKTVRARNVYAGKLLHERFTRGNEPTPELYRHLKGHINTVNSIVFHPSEPILATAGADNYVFYIDHSKPDKRPLRFEGHSGSINDVAFNISGDLMFTASSDLSIGICVPLASEHSGSCFIRGHSAAVRSVAVDPTRQEYFMSCSDDKTVKLWNIRTSINRKKITSHNFVGSWCGHHNWVRSVRFSTNGNKAITASDDGSVQVLDPRQPEVAQKYSATQGTPLHAEFNPASDNYFGMITSKEFHIFDTRSSSITQSYLSIHTENISKFTFHPSGDFAYTVGLDKKIKILDLIEGRPIFTIYGHSAGITAVAAAPDGLLFATGAEDKCVLLWKPTLLPYGIDELKENGIICNNSTEIMKKC